MTGITIGATKLKIPSDHASSFLQYLDLTCSNITQTLNKKGYELDVIKELSSENFSDEGKLSFRVINDNEKTSLDKSFELKLNSQNELYAVFNLGAVKLAAFSTSTSLAEIIKHLTHFNFKQVGDSQNYRAGVDVYGYTLPGESTYSSSISSDVIKYLESSVKDLRTKIFSTQDITLSITRKVTESLTEKFVSEKFVFPEIELKNEGSGGITIISATLDQDNSFMDAAKFKAHVSSVKNIIIGGEYTLYFGDGCDIPSQSKYIKLIRTPEECALMKQQQVIGDLLQDGE